MIFVNSIFKGRHVLITGGANGIGSELVKQFCSHGGNVSFIDKDNATGEKLAGEIGVTANYIYGDLYETESIPCLIDKAKEKFGLINILINNAAFDERHSITDISPREWNCLMSINLTQVVFTFQSCIDDLISSSGKVVNISSNCFLLGLADYPAYLAANASISALTKSFSREFGPKGININSIAPGWVITERQKKWLNIESSRKCLGEQSLKRHITPEDVSSACLYLASNASAAICGQTIVIDGGRV